MARSFIDPKTGEIRKSDESMLERRPEEEEREEDSEDEEYSPPVKIN